ncbi:MAG TPA: chemotaxis protein CheW [Burkholderiaceae bacterium]|nr:chemotaxis protein CheW [Burkholderiaceae bacterium]
MSLVVHVGARVCALPLQHVIETMRMLHVEAFPGAPGFVRGIALVRGVPVPVVEAARLLGTGPGPGARWVTLKTGERTVVLAVDEVLGVRAVPAEDRLALPPLLREASAEIVATLGRLDAGLLVVLQAAHAWPEALRSELERSGVPAA